MPRPSRIRAQHAVPLLGIICLLFSSPAGARIYIQVDQPSEKKFPIAVTPLTANGGKNSGDWDRKVSEKIRSDLKLTGLFDLMDPAQFPNDPAARSSNPATIKFAPWTLVGAQALVSGDYRFDGSTVTTELHLYDPFLGQHILGRTYRADPKDMSVVAHHFANEVMKELTGEDGVFDTKIAFTVIAGKHKKEIGVMDMDGDNAHTVTKDGSIDLSPSWGPGGRIAYSGFGKEGRPEIYVTGAKGGSRKITSNGNINLSPAFTPSGDAIAVASAVTGDTEIYLMGLNGKIIRQLTKSFGIDVNPSWSPDGSTFVFASERAGNLHIFKSTGERLTYVGYQNDNPSWSPKGDKILFQGRDSGTWDIFVMNSDGSSIQRLTSGMGSNESPTWAPNARFVSCSSTRNGKSQVVIMRDDGTNQTALPYKGAALQPAWGPKE